MTVSIIISTYNGAQKILNIIKALEQQTVQDFETIIMNDGSSDDTEKIISDYPHSLKKLKVISQSNQGRARVRNNGAEIATGDLLLFFDDDMRPLPTCVEEHIKFHKKNTSSFMTGGLGEDLAKCTTDIQRYKSYLSVKWVKELKEWNGPLVQENLFLTAANFSTSKQLFETTTGFDERLNDAEDWDLAIRAYKQNIPIYYHHKAFAWHDDFITCKSYIKRQKEYRSFHQKLLTLKPDLYQEFNNRQTLKPTGLKKIIYTFFNSSFWTSSIDHFNWLIILPQKFRYNVYDLIITSHYLSEK